MNRTASQFRFSSHRNHRGSTILLVISILSLLVLLAVGLAFTSRIEQSTASNFGDGVQNRMAAQTGVQAVSSQLLYSLPAGATGLLDLSLEPQFLSLREGTSLNSEEKDGAASHFRSNAASGAVNLAPGESTDTADVVLFDASARININAASEELLAGFFNLAGSELGVGLNGDAVARSIAEIRLGRDGAPGRRGFDDDFDSTDAVEAESRSDYESWDERAAAMNIESDEVRGEESRQLLTLVDEADEYIADVRLPAYGDDYRFASVSDLLNFESIRSAGLDREALEVLEPYLTIFSTSVEQRLVDDEVLPFLDANRAGPEELFDALKEVYGDGKDDDLLRQFAVNIVDARDGDSVPTRFPGTNLIGVERTPYIIEVYPDSITPDEGGDDGQFVELHNPWTEDFSVDGWRLTGAGVSVELRGRIAPQGFLILTDDADNSRDPAAEEDLPGTGSLYDVFGVLDDGYKRRVMEVPSLSLPDHGPVTLELLDDEGNLVDVFAFTARSDELDDLYSWQRNNPLVRRAHKARATPHGLAPRAFEPDGESLERVRNYPPNAPFTRTVQLMDVFAGYAGENESGTVVNWGFPVAGTPDSPDSRTADLAGNDAVIDGRILDALTVEWRARNTVPETAGDEAETAVKLIEARGVPAEMNSEVLRLDGGRFAVWQANNWFEPVAGTRHGRINLNTAPAVILAALPEVTPEAARRVSERRAEELAEVASGGAGDGLLYRRPSDVLIDDELLGEPKSRSERLDRFGALWEHASLNSRAFVLVGRSRVASGSGGGGQTGDLVSVLTGLDRGVPEYVSWGFRYD